MAAFLQTLETGFSISNEYLEIYGKFPANGVVDTQFVENLAALYSSEYAFEFDQNNPVPFEITKASTQSAIDMISCNMRQFILLFDSTNAPRASSIGKQIVVVAAEQQQQRTKNILNAQNESSKKITTGQYSKMPRVNLNNIFHTRKNIIGC